MFSIGIRVIIAITERYNRKWSQHFYMGHERVTCPYCGEQVSARVPDDQDFLGVYKKAGKLGVAVNLFSSNYGYTRAKCHNGHSFVVGYAPK